MNEKGLVIFKEEMDQINESLSGFLKQSEAKCVLLVDRDGHMMTKQGSTHNIDTSSLAVLVAGSFASTKEIARLVGEPEFSVLFHEGKKGHIHISLVDDHCMLVVMFDDRTTIGMVRLYAKEAGEKLSSIFAEAKKKEKKGEELGEDFTSSVEEKLDDLFK